MVESLLVFKIKRLSYTVESGKLRSCGDSMVSSIRDNYRALIGRLENQSFRRILIILFRGHIQKSITLCTSKVFKAKVSGLVIFLYRKQNILSAFNSDFRLSLSILETVSANDAVFL